MVLSVLEMALCDRHPFSWLSDRPRLLLLEEVCPLPCDSALSFQLQPPTLLHSPSKKRGLQEQGEAVSGHRISDPGLQMAVSEARFAVDQ